MRRTLVLLFWILLGPLTVDAQSVRVAGANENFHVEPGGTVIADLVEGIALVPGSQRDAWREATLEGWIWAPSVRPDERPGFDLVVNSRNGENLRAAPNGDRLARLRNGTLLVQVRREGQWILVKRTGWVRDAALSEPVAAIGVAPGSAEPSAKREAPAGESAKKSSEAETRSGAGKPVPGRDGDAPPGIGDLGWTGQAGARVLSAPDGDTLATIRPMAGLEVVDHQGGWTRVRVEGWVRTTALAATVDSGAVLSNLAPEVLLSSPDGFRGRVLEWQVQFIALDRAERIRTDFTEGEPFILARPPGDQPGFVYLAIPAELVAQAEALMPLQPITVLARVRTGRSEQMGAPILDLLEIR
jgi:hypothetical protein